MVAPRSHVNLRARRLARTSCCSMEKRSAFASPGAGLHATIKAALRATATKDLATQGIWMSLLCMSKPYFLSLLAVFLASFSRVVFAETPSTPKSEPGSGLEGVILVGPIQGGPTRQGVPDSRPLANTEFLVVKENSIVASFKTNDQGWFQISLPAGHYTISRKDWKASIGSYGPFEVEIAAGRFKKVQWDCDTGLR